MRKVRCPQCGKVTEYSSENPYRPFCCERCRLLDLGQWADENYRIPTQDQNVSSVSPEDESLTEKGED